MMRERRGGDETFGFHEDESDEEESMETMERPTIKCGHCGDRHASAAEARRIHAQERVEQSTKLPMNEKDVSEGQVIYALDLLKTRVWPQKLDADAIRAMDRRAASTLISGLLKAPPKPDYEVNSPVPDGRYAIMDDERVNFYEVSSPSTGKWVGHTFLVRLIGAPGSYRNERVGQPAIRAAILAVLATDPEEYMKVYGRESGHCGACHSPLTDPTSLARGLGPICAGKRGWL